MSRSVKIMAVEHDRVTGAFLGRLGVELTSLGECAKMRFVLLDAAGDVLVHSQEIGLRAGDTGSLEIYQEDGEEVGIEWVQEVRLAANSAAAMALLAAALKQE